MSERKIIHHARCCGCDLRIYVDGRVLRGDGENGFDSMSQVREAAREHRSFCTNYTGRFHIKAGWWHDGTAEWHIEVSA